MAVPKELDALKARSERCGLFHLATPEGRCHLSVR